MDRNVQVAARCLMWIFFPLTCCRGQCLVSKCGLMEHEACWHLHILRHPTSIYSHTNTGSNGEPRGKKKRKKKNIIGLLDNKEQCNNNKQTIYVSPLEIPMSFFSNFCTFMYCLCSNSSTNVVIETHSNALKFIHIHLLVLNDLENLEMLYVYQW